VIVVVGSVAWREAPAGPGGRTCDIALAAASRGAHPEIVARVGDDPAGDSLVIALGRAGVGHAALLRDPVRATPILAPAPDPDTEPELAELLADGGPGSGPAILGGPRLEPADVALGLQYLTAFAVLVVADDVPADVLPACVEGARFAGAHLVVLVPAGRPLPGELPSDATVLAAPDTEDEGAFAALVGAYAAAIDAGDAPASAFAAATGAAGWETAPPA
jgi:hypothetical protein